MIMKAVPEAIAASLRVLELPGNERLRYSSYKNLAIFYRDQGRLDEAMSAAKVELDNHLRIAMAELDRRSAQRAADVSQVLASREEKFRVALQRREQVGRVDRELVGEVAVGVAVDRDDSLGGQGGEQVGGTDLSFMVERVRLGEAGGQDEGGGDQGFHKGVSTSLIG